jgi:hypothetical protein
LSNLQEAASASSNASPNETSNSNNASSAGAGNGAGASARQQTTNVSIISNYFDFLIIPSIFRHKSSPKLSSKCEPCKLGSNHSSSNTTKFYRMIPSSRTMIMLAERTRSVFLIACRKHYTICRMLSTLLAI